MAAGHEAEASVAERGARHVHLSRLLAGAVSGAASAVATAPFDLAKTRLQVQHAARDAHHLRRYRGAIGTLRTVVAHEGARALFKGRRGAARRGAARLRARLTRATRRAGVDAARAGAELDNHLLRLRRAARAAARVRGAGRAPDACVDGGGGGRGRG
jgi:hypothetical protein